MEPWSPPPVVVTAFDTILRLPRPGPVLQLPASGSASGRLKLSVARTCGARCAATPCVVTTAAVATRLAVALTRWAVVSVPVAAIVCAAVGVASSDETSTLYGPGSDPSLQAIPIVRLPVYIPETTNDLALMFAGSVLQAESQLPVAWFHLMYLSELFASESSSRHQTLAPSVVRLTPELATCPVKPVVGRVTTDPQLEPL